MPEQANPQEVKGALMPFKASEPIQGRLLLFPAIGEAIFQTKPALTEDQKKQVIETPKIDSSLHTVLTKLSEAERNEQWVRLQNDWLQKEALRKQTVEQAGMVYTEKRFNAAELWTQNFKLNSEKGDNKAFLAAISAKHKGQEPEANYDLSDREISFFYSTFVYDRTTNTQLTTEVFVSKMNDIFGSSYSSLADNQKNSMLWLARQLFGGDVSGEMIMQLSDLNIKQKRLATDDERKTVATTLLEKEADLDNEDKKLFERARKYLMIDDAVLDRPKAVVKTDDADAGAESAKRAEELKKIQLLTEQILDDRVPGILSQPLDPSRPIDGEGGQMNNRLNDIQFLTRCFDLDDASREKVMKSVMEILSSDYIPSRDDKAVITAWVRENDQNAAPEDSSLQALQVYVKIYTLLLAAQNGKGKFDALLQKNPGYFGNFISLLQEDSSTMSTVGNENYSARVAHQKFKKYIFSVIANLDQPVAALLLTDPKFAPFMSNMLTAVKEELSGPDKDSPSNTQELVGHAIGVLIQLMDNGQEKPVIDFLEKHKDIAENIGIVIPQMTTSDNFGKVLMEAIGEIKKG